MKKKKIKNAVKNGLLVIGMIFTLALVLSSCKKSQNAPEEPIVQTPVVVDTCEKECTYYVSITSWPFIPKNIKYENCYAGISYGDSLVGNSYYNRKGIWFLPPNSAAVDSISYTFKMKKKEGFNFYVWSNMTPYIPLYIKLYRDGKLFLDTVAGAQSFVYDKFKPHNMCKDTIY